MLITDFFSFPKTPMVFSSCELNCLFSRLCDNYALIHLREKYLYMPNFDKDILSDITA